MRRPLAVDLLRALAAGLLLALAAPLAAAAAPVELSFTKLNRAYSDLVGPLAPVVVEPLTVALSSPAQTLHLRSHRVALRPSPDGGYDAEVEAEILGKGQLVAEVDVAGVRQRFADEVLLPPQTVRLAGHARLGREAGGYRVTVDRLPARLEVAIQSRLINDVLALCDGAAVLSLGALDCGPLGRALQRPALPLPATAELLLADADLTDADRAALEALVGAGVRAQP